MVDPTTKKPAIRFGCSRGMTPWYSSEALGSFKLVQLGWAYVLVDWDIAGSQGRADPNVETPYNSYTIIAADLQKAIVSNLAVEEALFFWAQRAKRDQQGLERARAATPGSIVLPH